jgi:hypothetical protein
MTLQLVLSFGHVHVIAANDRSSAVIATSAGAPASPPSSGHHPAGDTDDYCPICAVIHLAATSFIPQLPPLPVPLISQPVEHFSHVALIFLAPQRTAFQSRAPPLA